MNEIKGVNVSQQQKADMDALRAIFDPNAALSRMDGYGKWLFTSAAIVGSLGAGLSNSTFSRVRGTGALMFAIAIVILGMCLVAASLSIAPHWTEAQTSDLQSMWKAVICQFKIRRVELRWAAGLFAIALLLAAGAPLFSLFYVATVPVLHYSLDEKGALEAGVEASDQKAGTFIELRLVSGPSLVATLPKAGGTIDISGQAKLALKFSAFASLPENSSLVVCTRLPKEASCTERERVIVKP